MGGQKFEYDESGSTFFYFILSFLALVLIPATFYFWPKRQKDGKSHKITVNNSFFVISLHGILNTYIPISIQQCDNTTTSFHFFTLYFSH